MKVRKNGARLLRLALIVLICVGAVVVTVTTVYVHTKPREISVCLDAGHGAHDAGAVGGSRSEKDDNLRLALLVQSELEARGIRVYMTREDDTFLSLEERCKVANSNKCTLFVALHRNSAESGKGVEVWVANTPSDADWALGENIMNALAKTGDISADRGVKTGYAKNPDGNYYVNAHTKMPSCLAEIGFITSDEDNKLFDEHVQDYAVAIADGIEKTLTELSAQ